MAATRKPRKPRKPKAATRCCYCGKEGNLLVRESASTRQDEHSCRDIHACAVRLGQAIANGPCNETVEDLPF